MFSARCKDFRLTRIETLLLQVTLGNDDDDGNDEKDKVPGPCPDVEEWIRERFQKKKKTTKMSFG